jgi:hypothetical protein
LSLKCTLSNHHELATRSRIRNETTAAHSTGLLVAKR